MPEAVRLALIMLFKEALDKICVQNGVNSEQQRSLLINAITELEALAPNTPTGERPIISMPTREV